MSVLLLYSLTLLAAVLLSGLAQRSMLSTAVLFLVAGIGAAICGALDIRASDPSVAILAELALISVLFTDGMKTGASDLLRAWSLPGRALLLGMPLAVLGNGLAAALVGRLDWPAAFLVGAALSPTDPVFAAAIVGSQRVPWRLRQLLNVESGLNDGLALPIVLALLGVMGASDTHLHQVVIQLIVGAAIGVVVPWAAAWLATRRWLTASRLYEPILPVAVVLLVYSLCEMANGNVFIATFAAGITLATVGPEVSKSFGELGDWVSELLKLAALLLFGGYFAMNVLHEVGWHGIAFALLTLVVVRPVALGLALLGSKMPWRERVAAAWFGPKGFASVVFGLLILKTDLPYRQHYFELIALTIVGSIVAHSSTDVLVARWFTPETQVPKPNPAEASA
ncbi:MAG TPA: cation:proton antiporter [Pirellulales bacterium]|jgi:NhaP-type Na+/H+ or K+/H+ antiporter|nr:cation:proton antiporter [Pirellulales bacterium]